MLKSKGNDKKIANKLNELTKEVEYNGDFELAEKLKKEIENVGPADRESSKL